MKRDVENGMLTFLNNLYHDSAFKLYWFLLGIDIKFRRFLERKSMYHQFMHKQTKKELEKAMNWLDEFDRKFREAVKRI